MFPEIGPIRPFDDAQIPRVGTRTPLVGSIGGALAELETIGREIGSRAGQFAPSISAARELQSGHELGAAAAEHDRQSREVDSAIGSVAAGAHALEGDLAGLTSALGRELENASIPPSPQPPEEEFNDDWRDPDYRDIIAEWYVTYLGRDASDGELRAYYVNRRPLAAVLAGILASEEYQARQRELIGAPPPPGTPAPPSSTPPPPSGYTYYGGYIVGTPDRVWAYVAENEDKRDNVERFLADNGGGDWHRVPSALELDNWNSFIISRGL